MIRKITLVFLACFGLHSFANAQERCGFDVRHNQMLANDPAYANTVSQNNAAWSDIMTAMHLPSFVAPAQYSTGKQYEIPIVIHVMLPGGSNPVGSLYNPTDATLTAMVDYLNKAYACQWASYPDSMTGGTYIPFQFSLAKRDTACNPTTGIERVDASGVTNYTACGVGTGGANDQLVKNLARWPTDRYYNVWIVNKIDCEDGTGGGPYTAGYAYFAGAGPLDDGTIMLAISAHSGEETLPHEIGHAMNLYHVFQGGDATTCPTETNCATQNDLCCDTEPIKQSQFNCPADPNPCTGTSYLNTQKNFMDYSSCKSRFTPNQRDRMITALLGQRTGFIGSLGGQAPGAAPAAACTPTYSQPANTSNAGPRRVRIKDQYYTYLDYSSSGYNGDGNRFYIDRTCYEGATLDAGSIDTLMITTGFFAEKVRVFLDMNNDGTFAASEMIYSHDGAGNNEVHKLVWTVPSVLTVPGLVTCTPIRMRVVTDRTAAVTDPAACAIVSGQAEDYAITIKGSGAGGGTVSINQFVGAPLSCPGDQIKFAATIGNVASPTIKWFINNVAVTGATTDTFVTSTPVNGDQVKARIYFSTTCGLDSTTSNVIVVGRSGLIPPSATITNNAGPISCAGDTITFSVTGAVNPGTSPIYTWYLNGSNTGIQGTTYTATGLANGDVVNAHIKSNSSCAVPDTGLSNDLTVVYGTITPSNSIALINGNNPGCPNQTLTFLATPTNGGGSPLYTWKVNGVPAGGNIDTFAGIFNNGDIITATLHSSANCASPASATSNPITVVINYDSQTVTIYTMATMPVCATHPITFNATTLNIGETIQWQVNGANVPGATNNVFTTTTLNDNDVVTAVVSITNSCIANPIQSSNPIQVTVLPSTTPSITSTITQGSNPGCLDSLVEFTGTVSNFGVNPNIVWLVNGSQAGTGLTFTSSTLLNGDVVTFRVNQTDAECYTSDTLYSSTLMTLSITPPTPLLSLIGNMLVASGTGNYVWYGPNGLIPGVTGNTYHPTTLGAYWCVQTNVGCRSNPSNLLTISLLNVINYSLSDVKIYPNPTSGNVMIDWGSNVNVKIDVFNTMGQGLMHDEVNNQSKKVMDLSYLPAGEYFIVLKDQSGNSGTVKVTITK